MGGSNEYTSVIEVDEGPSPDTASFRLGDNDSFDMIFDSDVVVDDLTIRNLGGGGATFTADLMFPNGGRLAISGPSTDFNMNQPGANNNWYRVPKWSRLRVSIAEGSSVGVLLVSMVGRG